MIECRAEERPKPAPIKDCSNCGYPTVEWKMLGDRLLCNTCYNSWKGPRNEA